jgi:hypothetical protein
MNDDKIETKGVNVKKFKSENKDSIIEEFETFKNEDPNIYKFEIPSKYIFSTTLKVVKEQNMPDGRIIRYYENSVIEVVTKNKNITRVY